MVMMKVQLAYFPSPCTEDKYNSRLLSVSGMDERFEDTIKKIVTPQRTFNDTVDAIQKYRASNYRNPDTHQTIGYKFESSCRESLLYPLITFEEMQQSGPDWKNWGFFGIKAGGTNLSPEQVNMFKWVMFYFSGGTESCNFNQMKKMHYDEEGYLMIPVGLRGNNTPVLSLFMLIWRNINSFMTHFNAGLREMKELPEFPDTFALALPATRNIVMDAFNHGIQKTSLTGVVTNGKMMLGFLCHLVKTKGFFPYSLKHRADGLYANGILTYLQYFLIVDMQAAFFRYISTQEKKPTGIANFIGEVYNWPLDIRNAFTKALEDLYDAREKAKKGEAANDTETKGTTQSWASV